MSDESVDHDSDIIKVERERRKESEGGL